MLDYQLAEDAQLDPGIRHHVATLRAEGVETFESCEGGVGHAYHDTTVRFFGDRSEGHRAFAVALRSGLRAKELRRVWPVVEDEPTGPWWELVFAP